GTNNALTAKGNISLTSELSGSKGSALFFNGTKAGDIQLTAGKDIVLTGINPGSSDALYIKNTALSAGDRLMLTGSAATGAGVHVAQSTLNASQAVITGTTTGGNTGFSLTGTTLSGGLADLTNVTFSSAGSAAGAINLLDSSVVNEANRENLLAKRIENMTSIDMGGTAIFDDSSATDKGWSHDYTLEDLPNHGWIFNNTSVNAGGLVQLAGVGFSNTTMNITAGGLNISQSGPLQLTNTTMNVNGDVLLHSDMDLTLTGSRVNETATGDAAVNITAGQNITLSGTNISSTTGKVDVSLLAAGTDSGRIQVLNGSQVNTNGGNITLDQLNHTTATEDGSVSNPNAMTVKVNNSKLNTSAPAATDGTASESGNITLNAYNPNVNLSAPAYNTTVRNAGAMLELSGNSTLTGRDLIMRTTLEGGNATGLPVFLNNATLNASHDITLSGVAHPVTTNTTADDGTVTTNTTTPALAAIELRGAGNVLTAGGNITIENPASGNSNGVYLNGNASGKAQLTAGGTITLNGSSAGNGAGVLVDNSILNASQAVITGSSSTGKGFSLTNTTLEGSLTDLANVTFSSAGAGAGVTNLLDGSVVTSSNRDTMLGKSIENMTSIDMGGTAVFDDSAKDDKGWTHNYTHADNPNGGWIFNNTTVTAGGDVMLGGVGFTNSTVNVSSGNLSIDNNSAALLTGTTITVGDGAVNVHAGAGNIDLSKGNISAKGDITLQTDNGSISILGTSATATANITSDSGNISITSNTATGNALTFNYVDLNAQEGNISMSGVSSDGVGVVFKNGGYTASATSGHIDVYGRGETSGGSNSYSRTKGDIDFQGESKFKAKEGSISGRKVSDPQTSTPSIYWGSLFSTAANVSFDGDFAIKSTNGMYVSGPNAFTFLNGNSSFTSDAGNAGFALNGMTDSDSLVTMIKFNASHANVSMNFSSEHENVDVFQWYSIKRLQDGVVFSGDGNITFSAKGNNLGSVLGLGYLNNLNMTGKLVVNVVNELGDAVHFKQRGTTSLINADITGISNGVGGGIIFDGDFPGAVIDLNGNSFTGQSVTGNGVSINGNNVTITGGTLNGTSVENAGVAITGGSNYTIDGANVTGQSANGAGVSVTGNLAVNNDATIIGVSTGSGDGVNVNGTLLSDGGVTIKGDATTGSGVVVNGNTKLNNAT
ncbi:hypothetical protein PEH87_005525, partial [Salmonella enterica]|nr:hypothetical protein [Salmonella enterica]